MLSLLLWQSAWNNQLCKKGALFWPTLSGFSSWSLGSVAFDLCLNGPFISHICRRTSQRSPIHICTARKQAQGAGKGHTLFLPVGPTSWKSAQIPCRLETPLALGPLGWEMETTAKYKEWDWGWPAGERCLDLPLIYVGLSSESRVKAVSGRE